MRTYLAGNGEREFHLVKPFLQNRCGNSANQNFAFVAHNVGLISADDAIQTPTTLRITER